MKHLDRFSRQTPKEYLDEIDQALKSNFSFYENIRIRSVVSFQKEAWENMALALQAFPQGEMPEVKKSRRYDNFCLLEEWISFERLKEVLECLPNKNLIIDGTNVKLDEKSRFSFISYLPGLNEHSKYPGILIQSDQEHLHDNGVPVIKWDLPAYPTFYAAASDWIQLKDYNDWPRSSTVNKFFIFLPECRAWIKEIKPQGKKSLRFLVNAVDSCPQLKLKGLWKVDKTILPIDHLIKRNVFYLKIPSGEINTLLFYLIDETENIYDFYDETQRSSKNRNDILSQINSRPSLKKLILNARLLGESEKLELKPYIEPAHAKVDELIESVIAFANAEGGIILIGVNKKGVIEGIESKISPNPKKLKKELNSYIGQLRSLISEGIGKELEIKTALVKVGRNIVLVIEVTEGFQKPYSFSRNGKCFVRRGASNMPALPEDIPKMIESNPPDISKL